MKVLTPYVLIPMAATSLLIFAPMVQAVDVKLSGQINRMITSADNGDDSEILHLDNSASGTRFRLTGEQDLGNGNKVGVKWETQFQSNPSSAANASNVKDLGSGPATNGNAAYELQSRHRDIYFKGDWGKVSLGQGDGAANGITEMEQAGTFIVGYTSPEDMWGSMTFGSSGNKVSAVIDGMDGLSRNDRLRYDTPKIGPLTLSVDSGSGGKSEVAIRLGFDAAGKWKAGLAAWDQDDAGSTEGMGGSLSYLAPNGLNAFVSFAELDAATPGASDPTNTYVKLGYKFGSHAVSVDWGETKDKTDGVTGEHSGIQYVNSHFKAVEMYAGYKLIESDATGDAEDITLTFIGSRVKF